MCRSVPQMPAWVTATSTSQGPIVGTGVSVCNHSPGSFLSLRTAVIVRGKAVINHLDLNSWNLESASGILEIIVRFARSIFHYYGNRDAREGKTPQTQRQCGCSPHRAAESTCVRSRSHAPQVERLDAGTTCIAFRCEPEHAQPDRGGGR